MQKTEMLRLNTPKNVTRVKSSIELTQVMNSLGSIDDFSYKGYITTFDVVIVRLEKYRVMVFNS